MTLANPRMPDILESLAKLTALELRQSRMLTMTQWITEMAMANETDLRNEIDALKQIIIDDQTGDQKVVDALENLLHSAQDQIQALKDQIANVPPGVNFDDLISQIDGIKALVQPVSAADAPVTDPTIPPGETPVDPGTASLGGTGGT